MEPCYHHCHRYSLCWWDYPWNKWVTRTTLISRFDRLMGVNIAGEGCKESKTWLISTPCYGGIKRAENTWAREQNENRPSPKVIQVANCTTVGHHLRHGLCERCPPGVTWLFCGGLNENCSSAAVRKTVVLQTLYDAVTVSSQRDTADNFPFRCFWRRFWSSYLYIECKEVFPKQIFHASVDQWGIKPRGRELRV